MSLILRRTSNYHSELYVMQLSKNRFIGFKLQWLRKKDFLSISGIKIFVDQLN